MHAFAHGGCTNTERETETETERQRQREWLPHSSSVSFPPDVCEIWLHNKRSSKQFCSPSLNIFALSRLKNNNKIKKNNLMQLSHSSWRLSSWECIIFMFLLSRWSLANVTEKWRVQSTWRRLWRFERFPLKSPSRRKKLGWKTKLVSLSCSDDKHCQCGSCSCMNEPRKFQTGYDKTPQDNTKSSDTSVTMK